MMNAALRRINVGAILIVVVLLVVWQVAVVSGLVTFIYLPAPTEVWDALVEVAVSGDLWVATGHTLGVALLAGAIAIFAGLLLGLALGLLPWFRTYSEGTVDVLRSLPVVALMPVALLIWGPNLLTEVYIAIFAAIWPMTINTMGAVRSVHHRLREVADTFRLSTPDRIAKILVPAAAPTILVGARLAIVTALLVAITSEMFVNPQGLGWAVVESQMGLRPARMWAYALVCGVLGYLLNLVLVRGVRVLLPGSRATAGTGA